MDIDRQIGEHFARRLYREHPGDVYFNIRKNKRTGGLQGKIGWTSRLPKRRVSYRRYHSNTQEIVWVAAWKCRHPKRVGESVFYARSILRICS
jgi:hypothetical protein